MSTLRPRAGSQAKTTEELQMEKVAQCVVSPNLLMNCLVVFCELHGLPSSAGATRLLSFMQLKITLS